MPKHIAEQLFLSVSALNNLFKIVCGMTIMEYIRNRQLSLAGKELFISNIHIIDLAFKYGYETPEAFTKAFTRFHGFPPSFVKRHMWRQKYLVDIIYINSIIYCGLLKEYHC